MKYLVVFSLIAAVASAGFVKPNLVDSVALAEVQEIVAAINSPSTDPATAAALEQLLLETFGVSAQPSPIAVGPAFIEFPVPDGAIPAETPAIVPAPAATPAADAASPLVQIILNINQASSDAAAVAPAAVEAAVVPASPAVALPAVVPILPAGAPRF